MRRTSSAASVCRLAPRIADGRSIEVLRHCFTGEKFSFHGKRYDFDDVVIRPRYVQPGARRCGLLRCRRPARSGAARMTATSCRRAHGRWCSIRGARR